MTGGEPSLRRSTETRAVSHRLLHESDEDGNVRAIRAETGETTREQDVAETHGWLVVREMDKRERARKRDLIRV